MTKTIRTLTVLLGISAATLGNAEEMSAEQIRECMAQNYPSKSVKQILTLNSTDRAGGNRLLHTVLYARADEKRTSMMMKVEKPNELAGARYLYREKTGKDELFMYVPAVDRIRRVKGSQKNAPLWGTDFSYEDIRQLRGSGVDTTTTKLDDANLNGRDAYQLEVRPVVDSANAEQESSYERVVSIVDKETCLPMQVSFYETGDEPRKRMTSDPEGFIQVNDTWAATKIVMEDLRDETQTTLDITNISYDESIPSQIFSSQNFHRGG